MYGIAAVKFGEKTIGYIEKGSWDWGGTKPESTDIDAEQVPDAPVLTRFCGPSGLPSVLGRTSCGLRCRDQIYGML